MAIDHRGHRHGTGWPDRRRRSDRALRLPLEDSNAATSYIRSTGSTSTPAARGLSRCASCRPTSTSRSRSIGRVSVRRFSTRPPPDWTPPPNYRAVLMRPATAPTILAYKYARVRERLDAVTSRELRKAYDAWVGAGEGQRARSSLLSGAILSAQEDQVNSRRRVQPGAASGSHDGGGDRSSKAVKPNAPTSRTTGRSRRSQGPHPGPDRCDRRDIPRLCLLGRQPVRRSTGRSRCRRCPGHSLRGSPDRAGCRADRIDPHRRRRRRHQTWPAAVGGPGPRRADHHIEPGAQHPVGHGTALPGNRRADLLGHVGRTADGACAVEGVDRSRVSPPPTNRPSRSRRAGRPRTTTCRSSSRTRATAEHPDEPASAIRRCRTGARCTTQGPAIATNRSRPTEASPGIVPGSSGDARLGWSPGARPRYSTSCSPVDLVDTPRRSSWSNWHRHGSSDGRSRGRHDRRDRRGDRAEPALVVVDAPLVVPNESGQRDVERILAWCDVPAFPSPAGD